MGGDDMSLAMLITDVNDGDVNVDEALLPPLPKTSS